MAARGRCGGRGRHTEGQGVLSVGGGRGQPLWLMLLLRRTTLSTEVRKIESHRVRVELGLDTVSSGDASGSSAAPDRGSGALLQLDFRDVHECGDIREAASAAEALEVREALLRLLRGGEHVLAHGGEPHFLFDGHVLRRRSAGFGAGVFRIHLLVLEAVGEDEVQIQEIVVDICVGCEGVVMRWGGGGHGGGWGWG